jgi:hypothetical protein
MANEYTFKVLNILLENIDSLETGLCKLATSLVLDSKLSVNEYFNIADYMKLNRPAGTNRRERT